MKPYYRYWYSTGKWVRNCSYWQWYDHEREHRPYCLSDPWPKAHIN